MRSGNVCEWELKSSPGVRGGGPWDVWGLQQVVRPLSLATFGGTLSPCLPLGPSQEDEEGYTLRILTLVSLKGFLVGGLVLEGMSCWGRNNGAGLWSDGRSVTGCLFLLPACACSVAQSCPTLCNPMDKQPARLLCPWDSPGTHTGAGCHLLLQGTFPTQRQNLCLLRLLHWEVDSLPLYHCAPWEAPVSSGALVITHRHENRSPIPSEAWFKSIRCRQALFNLSLKC